MKKKMDNLPDEIINFDITNIQDYMINEAWEALQQLDKVTLHFNHTIINTKTTVTTKRLEWMWSHCQLSTTHRDMIECDDCCRWFHW